MPTLLCEQCGAPARSGEAFCGECGAFLAWEDATSPTGRSSPATPATPDAVVTPAPGSAPDPARAPDPVRDVGTATRAADPMPDGGTAPAVDGAPVRPSDGAPARAGDGAPERAGERPEYPDAADPPMPVQPARPAARRPTVRTYADDRDIAPEDVACPDCGAGNSPSRSFCRRCGARLAGTARDAPRTTRRRWWRLRRRVRGWGLLRGLLTGLVVLALLAGLGYGAVVLGRRASDAVRDRLAAPVPVHPVSVGASSEAPGHPAAFAADGVSNHYWAPATTGPADGEHVELTFGKPFRLLDLIVHAGAAPDRDVFLTQARPAELELTAWTDGGDPVRKILRLADRPGEQKFHWAVSDVVRVRVTVRADYGDAPDRRVAIGEVEFFKRP